MSIKNLNVCRINSDNVTNRKRNTGETFPVEVYMEQFFLWFLKSKKKIKPFGTYVTTTSQSINLRVIHHKFFKFSKFFFCFLQKG